MNIAMISYHTCPLATLGGKDTGGMNVYVRDLTKFLGENNIHVDIFTRSQDEHVPHILHDLGYGNRIVHIPAGEEKPLPKESLPNYIDQFTENILEFASTKNYKYDLIHSHYWLSGLAAIELKKSWNIPIIQMFHTLAKLKNNNAKSNQELDNQKRIDFEFDVISNVDGIIAATDLEKSQLVDLYNADENKIHVVPPGVDLSRFYPIDKTEAKEVIGIPTEGKLVLYVGRIEPLKGIGNLIKAISFLKQPDIFSECPHYVVIIGGDPDIPKNDMDKEMLRLKELSNKLGLEDLVLFLGKKDQDNLPYYYSAAEAVVMPSYYESFGMVALESMACGTPVIATKVGGLSFLVQDGVTGLSVPSDDSQTLAEKLLLILCKDGLRDKLGSNGIKFAQDFGWQTITRQIIDVYKQIT